MRAMSRTLHRDSSMISRESRLQETTRQRPMPLDRWITMPRRLARKRDFAGFSSGGSASRRLMRFYLVLSSMFCRGGWLPEQISGTLKLMLPDGLDRWVSAETIYTGIYALTRCAFLQVLIARLRKARRARLPHAHGTDRCEQLTDMTSIHVRLPAVDDRALPGHWESDFIKGAGNLSVMGVLIERHSRLVLLDKIDDDTATFASAPAGYSRKLNSLAPPMYQSLTYDQGKEMTRHAELTAQTGLEVYFCDPRSPLQRGSCENTNGFASAIPPEKHGPFPLKPGTTRCDRRSVQPATTGHPRVISADQRNKALLERLNHPNGYVH